MNDRGTGQQTFDEGAALEELERVRKEIERYQSERKALEEEFEQFTASFRNPAAPPLPAAPPGMPPSPAPPSASPAALGPETLDDADRFEDEDPVPQPIVIKPDTPYRSPRRSLRVTPLMIAGGVIVVAGVSFAVWMQSRPTVQPSSAPVVQTRATPPPDVRTAPPAAQPARHESFVTTTRAVWVRVIADGVPVAERELPANTRLPFVAREKIVIRTGDAGAVRLTIGGVDQGALGRVGEVVTRRFDVPR